MHMLNLVLLLQLLKHRHSYNYMATYVLLQVMQLVLHAIVTYYCYYQATTMHNNCNLVPTKTITGTT